jgi:hypothetical protein
MAGRTAEIVGEKDRFYYYDIIDLSLFSLTETPAPPPHPPRLLSVVCYVGTMFKCSLC